MSECFTNCAGVSVAILPQPWLGTGAEEPASGTLLAAPPRPPPPFPASPAPPPSPAEPVVAPPTQPGSGAPPDPPPDPVGPVVAPPRPPDAPCGTASDVEHAAAASPSVIEKRRRNS